MRPQIDPSRHCLRVSEWPSADRAAWHNALSNSDPVSFERSTAASWKPATCHKNRRGYGRWLTFLRNAGEDFSIAPDVRVTPESVATYLDELRRQDLAPYTLRNRIFELYAVMSALASSRDWSWLRTRAVQLDRRALAIADRSLPPVLAADLVARSSKELRRRIGRPVSHREALAYRNWLMILTLTVLPICLRNFAALSLKHLERRNGTWWVDIDGSETKTGRPHAALIPTDVCRFLDHYLSHVRPHFAHDTGTDKVWLSRSGTPMAEHTIYITVTDLTKRAFGTPLNPHLFRRIFATSVSIANPEAIEGARAALGHTTRRTTQDHYNRASSITAARAHATILQSLRER